MADDRRSGDGERPRDAAAEGPPPSHPPAGRDADPPSRGLSRRGFLTTAGLGAVGLAATGRGSGAATTAQSATVGGAERVKARLSVNGRPHDVLVEPRWSLLWVLRQELGLTGAKPGCERGECGACTVLLDGVTRYSCLTLALEAEGAEVETLEGLLEGEELGVVQRAFADHDAYQCGYCTPGQIVAVEGLLRENPDPTPEEIRIGVSGNLCRCGAYPNIFRAAADAAGKRRGGRS